MLDRGAFVGLEYKIGIAMSINSCDAYGLVIMVSVRFVMHILADLLQGFSVHPLLAGLSNAVIPLSCGWN